MWRFSLLTFMGFVTFCGLALCALRYANDLWRYGIVFGVLIALLVASLRVFLLQPGQAPFAAGFALFGWIYLAIVFWDDVGLRHHLPTTVASRYVGNALGVETEWPQGHIYYDSNNSWSQYLFIDGSTSTQLRLSQTSQHPAVNFYFVSHGLWTWFLAVCGGFLARQTVFAQRTTAQAPRHAASPAVSEDV